jgi:hypothetical protein
MSFQGKQLSEEIIELVVRLKNHHDEERKAGKSISTKDPTGRTAKALGLGVVTVKRIMSRYAKSGGKVVVPLKRSVGRLSSRVCPSIQPIVRQFIRAENLLGHRVGIDRVFNFLISEYKIDIPKMTLWRALNRWGFTHGEGSRRNSLREHTRVILARRNYLRVKLANRNADGTLKRPEVYLDETYVNKNHPCGFTWYFDEDDPLAYKPSVVGPGYILVHAITKNGWVDGAQLVFEAKKQTGSYQGQMNWGTFSRWFECQVLPNIPAKSIVILDNAKYHNVVAENSFPNNGYSKEHLRLWLTRNGYPWREDMLTSELLELCTRLAPVPEYRLDKMAAEHGVLILRVPPYHPELQPIETCWAIVKNHIAHNCDFVMPGLPVNILESLEMVKPNTCREIIAKIALLEKKYWTEDEKLDEAYTKNAVEDRTDRCLVENEGEDSCLGDL